MGERAIEIEADGGFLTGDLAVPAGASGVVAFAHGSGSSRLSPRNRQVAEALHRGGLATLLMDLLTPEEEQLDLRTGRLRFDIPLLAERLVQAFDRLSGERETQALPIGAFGASTGAAAALVAAALRPETARAVVSRGGRPDLAAEHIPGVSAPTLLIVGAEDPVVLSMNRAVVPLFRTEVSLEIVPGAGHLFEERGALVSVANLAGDWFLRHLLPA